MRKDQEPSYRKRETILRPFGFHDKAPVIKSMRERIDRLGIPGGMAEFFRELNFKINIVGDTSRWDQAGKPALLIGEHANGFEHFAMLAVFGQMQREDVRFITMPHMPASVLAEKIDPRDDGYFMSVIPGRLASDYPKRKIDEFTPSRLFSRRRLLPREEGKAITNKTLQNAAELLNQGFAINIFPTGNVRYSMETPWRTGIGEIISQTSEEKRADITIVPYRFSRNFSMWTLFRATLCKNLGLKMREKTVTLHVGQQTSAHAIIEGKHDAKEITRALQTYYLQSF